MGNKTQEDFYGPVLDAYGHLTWTVSERVNKERADWMACFDARRVYAGIEYHVVVNSDSGGLIQTAEEGLVKVEDAESLFGLPENYWDIGSSHTPMRSPRKTAASWRQHIRRLMKLPRPKKDPNEKRIPRKIRRTALVSMCLVQDYLDGKPALRCPWLRIARRRRWHPNDVPEDLRSRCDLRKQGLHWYLDPEYGTDFEAIRKWQWPEYTKVGKQVKGRLYLHSELCWEQMGRYRWPRNPSPVMVECLEETLPSVFPPDPTSPKGMGWLNHDGSP